ncbi:DUF2339 domain-containing protein [Lacibacterium aquatile]|uniref:DUF2339 domain-containing protein n=1 Tax=Lacibacterium aquatile TaxID=1168082 RepID=A0ABW5DLS1_9PROT
MDEIVLILLVVLVLFVGPWILIFTTRSRLTTVEMRLQQAEATLRRLTAAPPAVTVAPETATPVQPPVQEPAPQQVTETPASPPPVEPVAAKPVAAKPVAAAPVPVKAAEPAKPTKPKQSLEDWLTGKLGVIVGAIALGFGAIFLVKYSIEAGLLGPGARVTAGIVTGILLHLAAEWTRRRPGKDGPGYVPSALAAGGSVAIYGALYAAHGLYGMLPSVIAFPLLALTAVGTAAAALLHGPAVAAIAAGLVYLAPLLIESTKPNPGVLFGYIAIAGAGFLLLARWGAWRWLTAVVVGATALWHIVGLITFEDKAWLEASLALIVQGGFTAWFLTRPPLGNVPVGRFGPLALPMPALVAVISTGVLSALLGFWLWAAGIGGEVAMIWQFAIVGILLLARRRSALLVMVPWMGIGTAALALLWRVPGPIEQAYQPWLLTGTLVPGAIQGYLTPLMVLGATWAVLAGTIAFEVNRKARGLWATVSVAVPLLVFAFAYTRVTGLDTSLPFAAVGLALAAACLGAAERMARRFWTDEGNDENAAALAAYAAGVLCALSLAAAMGLRDSWLTLALSLPLPGLAWLHQRLKVPGLGTLAGLLAGAVTIRLVLNPEVIDYGLGPWGVLWTFGAPAILVGFAGWLFGALPRLADGLKSAALVFVGYLIAAEALVLTSGTVNPESTSFASAALTFNGWLAIALIQQRLGRTMTALVIQTIASACVIFGPLLPLNPLFTGDLVGTVPVFNLLGLAFGMPAILSAALAIHWERSGHGIAAKLSGTFSLALLFVWITLEVRRAFSGPDLSAADMADAEFYAYSAVWLLFGLGLLGAGLWRRVKALRLGGLVLVTLAVAKVFLLDMSALEGLMRALSFMGLGAALVGIGYAYQRIARR